MHKLILVFGNIMIKHLIMDLGIQMQIKHIEPEFVIEINHKIIEEFMKENEQLFEDLDKEIKDF
jgi:hypothetical protein